jgi:uncharacterized protein
MHLLPLSKEEIDFLNDAFLKYGNDASILDTSELDGFLTAIVSGPNMVVPSQWYPELWGQEANQPEWESESEVERFFLLVIQHMNNIAEILMESPDDFAALLSIDALSETPVLTIEEWCFGYMKGAALGSWPKLESDMQKQLDVIALFGLEENVSTFDDFTSDQYQNKISEIESATRKLHAYFLEKRSH